MAIFALLVLQLLCSGFAKAQAGTATGIVNPTIAASTATIVPSASGFAYVGCYDETIHAENGSARALSGGRELANNVMNVELCLSQCTNGDYGAAFQFAGLEFGRECYCAQYLSSNSTKLDEKAKCNYACNGNSSQICGGADAISLYNITDYRKRAEASELRGQMVWVAAVMAAVMTVVLV